MPPLIPIFIASLLGSAHCAAMCGGFVCLYAGEERGPLSHVAYNGGRLVSYLIVGTLAGLLGAGVENAALLVGISRGAAILSGALLLAWGTTLLLKALGIRVPLGTTRFGQRLLAPLLARTRDASPTVRAGTIGVLSALLPCGWLYAFAVTAAGTGSVPGALVVMATFWAGTLPAMATVGLGLQRLAGPLRPRLPMVTAVVVMLIGALSISGRLATSLHTGHTAAAPAHAHR
ncbi:MAG: sulfite exporter TauE/SafE family protein [Gemmatimonadetes bacterium]|nr:sulfite exporter TauE/SafE family protein [Gemmatimonadota bacterium]